MRLPRSLSGTELAGLLRRSYGYTIVRQTGSHMRLTSTFQETEHHITIPRHNPLRVGTLNAILSDVSDYLGIDRQVLLEELFGR